MTIQSELRALQQRDTILKPSRVVAWAQAHAKSALHGALEWDDSVAAHEHRLWQVRQMIAIHVVNKKGQREIISLSIDRTSVDGGYRHVSDILESPTLRDIMLADALNELERIQLKYNSIQALVAIWREVKRAKQKHGRRSSASLGRATHSRAGHNKAKQPKLRKAA